MKQMCSKDKNRNRLRQMTAHKHKRAKEIVAKSGKLTNKRRRERGRQDEGREEERG